MSKNVIVYTQLFCPYCTRARSLLKKKRVEFKEIRVDKDDLLRKEMEERSRRHTVPQIFIGDFHVGGYDDLAHFEHTGELDKLLEESASQKQE